MDQLPPLLSISYDLLDVILGYLTPRELVRFSMVSKEVGVLLDSRGHTFLHAIEYLFPANNVQFTMGKYLNARLLLQAMYAKCRGGRHSREVASRPSEINDQWFDYLSLMKNPESGEVNCRRGYTPPFTRRCFLGAECPGCSSDTDYKTNPMILPPSRDNQVCVNVAALRFGAIDISLTCLNPDCSYSFTVHYELSSFCCCHRHDDSESIGEEEGEVVSCTFCEQSTCTSCMLHGRM